MTARARVVAVALTAAAAFIGGCGGNDRNPRQPSNASGGGGGRSQVPDPSPDTYITRPGSTAIPATDPCANELHDLAGAFLLYYFKHNKLPDRLDDLKTVGGNVAPAAVECPASKRPYVYDPDGFMIQGQTYLVILYDPEPAHGGMRMALAVQQPQPGKALVTKVVQIPEPHFIPVRAD